MTDTEPDRQGDADGMLTAARPRLPAAALERLLRERYGLSSARLQPLSGERDQNLLVTTPQGEDLVLKIAGAAEDPAYLACQNAALEHIAATDPTLPVPRLVRALSGEDIVPLRFEDRDLNARLLTHVPGTPALLARATPLFRRRLGGLIARLDKALAGFDHPGAPENLIWNLSRASTLRDRIAFIGDPQRRRLAESVAERFDRHAAPAFQHLRRQFIHNDINQNNVMRGPGTAEITGIIDFGDMARSCLVNELAIAIAHQLYRQEDVLAAAGEFLQGYAATLPVEPGEAAILFDLVKMRLLAREIIAAWRAAESGGAIPYSTEISALGWQALERCMAVDPALATQHLETIVTPTPTTAAPRADEADAAYETLMERRRTFLGPLYKQFYEQPFFPVKGEGVWVTDHRGRRYLDAYNNVPHVGHCHPHVAEVIARQARTFNSNTRYPSDLIVDYAERIAATMPDPLKVCMFVCSGTEANELAWRIAKANTGGDGALVTRSAFHGNSTVIGALDTSTLAADRLEPWVATVPAPAFPGVARDGAAPSSAADHAEDYRRSIAGLAERGHRPAALFVCPVFASDGLYSVPEGHLAPAMAEVRKAGGLIVADEVQTALGRTGTHFWGFEHAGITPDIVTMAKPMGNGIPLAVVVTSRELVEGFLRRERYFNTFGGNQVAAAAGMAVLDVLAEEGLQDNALAIGGYLRAGLAELMDRYPLIGDVRGTGLFAGVEIVADGKPAPAKARAIIEGLLRRGVLVGITGADRNLLKIRPPMIFARQHADLLIEGLDETLKTVS